MYCLCVNVYCITATVCQPNCSYQIYHINIKRLIILPPFEIKLPNDNRKIFTPLILTISISAYIIYFYFQFILCHVAKNVEDVWPPLSR
jgi:hypothetical protein